MFYQNAAIKGTLFTATEKVIECASITVKGQKPGVAFFASASWLFFCATNSNETEFVTMAFRVGRCIGMIT